MLKKAKLAEKRRAKSLKRKAKAKEARRKKEVSKQNKTNSVPTPSKEELTQAVLGLYEINNNVQMALNRLEKFCFSTIKLLLDSGKITRDDLDSYSKAILEYGTIDEFWEASAEDVEERLAAREKAIAEAAEAEAAAQAALEQIKAEAEIIEAPTEVEASNDDTNQDAEGGAIAAP